METKVKKIIAEQLNIEYEKLELTSQLALLNNWDSLVALRIMSNMENLLGVKVPLQTFIQAKTINDLIKLVS